MDVGVRVIRGRSWNWDDQDGGVAGTVVKPFESPVNTIQSGTVFVQWDNGCIGNYRVGRDGECDLRLFDSGPAGIRFSTTRCDECNQKEIVGTRWKCAVCDDYDLCHACYHSDKHNLMHHFFRYDSLSASRVEVPSRANSEKSEVCGIFPGATVVRRVEDWLHGQNDVQFSAVPQVKQSVLFSDQASFGLAGGMGGMPGTVLEDPPPRQLSSNRGSVMVLWENGDTVEHSCGNDGKVALKCVAAKVGREYYVQHLADLAADQFTEEKFLQFRDEDNESPRISPIDPGQSIDGGLNGSFHLFRPGDRVQVNVDVNIFRALQDDQHGGWNPEMELCIGATGVVVDVNRPQIVVVQYKGLKKNWAINPEALSKKLFDVGDRVRILPDERRVQSLQKGHGGWVQKMKEDLGKVAEVVGIGNGSRVFVKVESRPYRWTLNVNCCTLVECNSDTGPQESSDSDSDESDVSASSPFMDAILSQHSDMVRPELLVQFAAKNKVAVVRAIVQKYPQMINMKNQDKTALHMSCLKGHVTTVGILLDAGADITATDNEGNTPVHYAVHRKDDPRVLEFILARNVNHGDLINFALISVLHMAVHRKHPRCVQSLIQHGCNVNVQDQSGDTALHDAITVGQRDVIETLANCPRVDFSLMNERGFNVLQLAAFKGDGFAVEQIVRQAPHLANDQKSDGFTALHIACINGHREATEILITKGNASTELKNRERHTPLMIALTRAKVSTMEVLIIKGANPNACDGDGETCLHWILKLITSFQMGRPDGRETPVADLYDAPEIASIVTQLPSSIKEPSWFGVALFLVQHGADIYQQNNAGISPIQILQDQKLTDILLQAQQRYRRNVNAQRKDPVIPRQPNSAHPKITQNHGFSSGGSNPVSSAVFIGNPSALRLSNPSTSVPPTSKAPARSSNPTSLRPNNPTL